VIGGNEVAVETNRVEGRYEARVDGHVAVLEYDEDGDRITLIHTEVPEALGGRGLGGRLARAALEDARARHLRVIPQCEFVAGYILRHQEYLPLVAPEYRDRVTAPESGGEGTGV
jgi:predicted GNAT family acetyltransferase